MFQKASGHRRSPSPAALAADAAPTAEPRGHVWREDPIARMRRERDEFAARHGFGWFG